MQYKYFAQMTCFFTRASQVSKPMVCLQNTLSTMRWNSIVYTYIYIYLTDIYIYILATDQIVRFLFSREWTWFSCTSSLTWNTTRSLQKQFMPLYVSKYFSFAHCTYAYMHDHLTCEQWCFTYTPFAYSWFPMHVCACVCPACFRSATNFHVNLLQTCILVLQQWQW